LFLDVCVQSELGPDGTWPLVTVEECHNVTRLFALGRALGIRQGGVVCQHGPDGDAAIAESPPHGLDRATGLSRPQDCVPRLPIQVWPARAMEARPTLDREHAIYVSSGCSADPDAGPHTAAFMHLTSGIRDAVVFGGGVEYGLDRAVRALLRRRIRVHVALDAAGAADASRAQTIVAEWKRRGVDGATVAMIHRLLGAR
jgi:hypothetical protein